MRPPRRLLLLVIAGVLAVDAFRMAPRPRPPSALAAKKKKRRKSGAAKPSSAAEAPVAPPAFAFPTAEAIGAPMDGAEVTAPARDVSPAVAKMEALEAARRGARPRTRTLGGALATPRTSSSTSRASSSARPSTPSSRRGAPAARRSAREGRAGAGGGPRRLRLPKFELPETDAVARQLGGRKPDDPLDAFDYGIGGIVKRSVFFLGISAFAFDPRLNSPFFERGRAARAHRGQGEMAKYQPEKDGGD
ncbi:hypothetical protein SO694_00054150 [Aureococcus anophagefferens]|uniref:Uncharacterized protein n=1 Tax=Aureococcus anophagefferens TaxID=44056 RepID=A0ABR1FXN9_AURAN